MSQPRASCAHHPEQPSDGVCARCGDYVCQGCRSFASGATELCVRCDAVVGTRRYYPVPVWRFLLFGFGTFGLYVVYWAYRNWKQIKQHDKSDIWPLPRALFFGFSHFSLVNDLNAQLAARERSLVSSGFPAAYLVLSFLSRGADKIAPDNIVLSAFLLALGLLSVIPALLAVRALTGAEELAALDATKPRHIVGIILTVLLVLLVTLGASGFGEDMPEG